MIHMEQFFAVSLDTQEEERKFRQEFPDVAWSQGCGLRTPSIFTVPIKDKERLEKFCKENYGD